MKNFDPTYSIEIVDPCVGRTIPLFGCGSGLMCRILFCHNFPLLREAKQLRRSLDPEHSPFEQNRKQEFEIWKEENFFETFFKTIVATYLYITEHEIDKFT